MADENDLVRVRIVLHQFPKTKQHSPYIFGLGPLLGNNKLRDSKLMIQMDEERTCYSCDLEVPRDATLTYSFVDRTLENGTPSLDKVEYDSGGMRKRYLLSIAPGDIGGTVVILDETWNPGNEEVRPAYVTVMRPRSEALLPPESAGQKPCPRCEEKDQKNGELSKLLRQREDELAKTKAKLEAVQAHVLQLEEGLKLDDSGRKALEARKQELLNTEQRLCVVFAEYTAQSVEFRNQQKAMDVLKANNALLLTGPQALDAKAKKALLEKAEEFMIERVKLAVKLERAEAIGGILRDDIQEEKRISEELRAEKEQADKELQELKTRATALEQKFSELVALGRKVFETHESIENPMLALLQKMMDEREQEIEKESV